MTVYAQIANNFVINVIVADQEFIDILPNSADYVLLTEGGIGWAYVDGVFIEPPPAPFEP
jgi:hypothetical protein